MAGGTPEHAFLASRVGQLIGNQLVRPCRVGSSDMKIATESGLTTYPDLSVICGPPRRDPRDTIAVTNPVVLVAVTSPSTEEYARGATLDHYRSIDSVRAILIVSHAEPRVTAVRRDGTTWSTTEHRAGDRIEIPLPQLALSIDEIYEV